MEVQRAQSASYVGEKFREKRQGHGIYTYENKYFKYEGQWKNGKKHGRGKLTMQDGSYYEGTFANGEINGKGFRYFSTTGCKYMGQFENGELHGQGKMIYTDGSIYDGQWYRNRKHGFGVMRSCDSAVYEGVYQGNQRHGEGVMLYSSLQFTGGLSNGDQYSGQWINDRREGVGTLVCKDGTVYNGDFKDDMFHGTGVMKQSSGYTYEGQWREGQPITIATKIVIKIEENPYIVRQGVPFTICVECQDENGELVPAENGRELQLIAGFKYYPPKEGSVLFDMIEDVEDKPIDTPFGYQVVPYPITDVLKTDEPDDAGAVEEDEDQMLSKSGTNLELNEEEIEDEREDEEEKEKGDDGEQKVDEGEEPKNDEETEEKTEEGGEGDNAEEQEKDGQTAESEGQTDGEEKEEKQEGPEVEAVPLPPSVPNHRTENGTCEWDNLQLAPAPPMYRPFVAMEEASNSKYSRSRAPSKAKIGIDQPSLSRSHSITSNPGASYMNILDKYRKKKDKAREEVYARLGEYVLIVSDVTSPPAMERTLDPAFLLLKVKRPKREKVKRAAGPKWDTQKHIAAAMAAQT